MAESYNTSSGRIAAHAMRSQGDFDIANALDDACDEVDRLNVEVQLARERLGPAGWKLIQELRELRLKDRES